MVCRANESYLYFVNACCCFFQNWNVSVSDIGKVVNNFDENEI